jgi:hypothetical protein
MVFGQLVFRSIGVSVKRRSTKKISVELFFGKMNQNRKQSTINIQTLTIHQREFQWKQFTANNITVASLLILYGEVFAGN